MERRRPIDSASLFVLEQGLQGLQGLALRINDFLSVFGRVPRAPSGSALGIRNTRPGAAVRLACDVEQSAPADRERHAQGRCCSRA
jgi:hypothetical protein